MPEGNKRQRTVATKTSSDTADRTNDENASFADLPDEIQWDILMRVMVAPRAQKGGQSQSRFMHFPPSLGMDTSIACVCKAFQNVSRAAPNGFITITQDSRNPQSYTIQLSPRSSGLFQAVTSTRFSCDTLHLFPRPFIVRFIKVHTCSAELAPLADILYRLVRLSQVRFMGFFAWYDKQISVHDSMIRLSRLQSILSGRSTSIAHLWRNNLYLSFRASATRPRVVHVPFPPLPAPSSADNTDTEQEKKKDDLPSDVDLDIETLTIDCGSNLYMPQFLLSGDPTASTASTAASTLSFSKKMRSLRMLVLSIPCTLVGFQTHPNIEEHRDNLLNLPGLQTIFLRNTCHCSKNGDGACREHGRLLDSRVWELMLPRKPRGVNRYGISRCFVLESVAFTSEADLRRFAWNVMVERPPFQAILFTKGALAITVDTSETSAFRCLASIMRCTRMHLMTDCTLQVRIALPDRRLDAWSFENAFVTFLINDGVYLKNVRTLSFQMTNMSAYLTSPCLLAKLILYPIVTSARLGKTMSEERFSVDFTDIFSTVYVHYFFISSFVPPPGQEGRPINDIHTCVKEFEDGLKIVLRNLPLSSGQRNVQPRKKTFVVFRAENPEFGVQKRFLM